jgi:AraC-like DNA-binding protein/mannose-6-phosphate isomerase-like protein (cupin superfamily)
MPQHAAAHHHRDHCRKGKGGVAGRRSVNPGDYQELRVPVAAMRKVFADTSTTGFHDHRRHQLIFAAEGTMRIDTASASWIVPPARALFMPSCVQHCVTAFGEVDMCTLYVEPHAIVAEQDAPFVILVSTLLRELISALLGEPVDYPPQSRGDLIAHLILDEIGRGKPLDFSIAMPQDERLLRACNRIIGDPSDNSGIDEIAEMAGASPRTLSRLFQRELGQSLSAWRQNVRFHFAMGAVAQGTPISQIASACGYRSPSAFAAAFRKSFGVAPSRFMPPGDHVVPVATTAASVSASDVESDGEAPSQA